MCCEAPLRLSILKKVQATQNAGSFLVHRVCGSTGIISTE